MNDELQVPDWLDTTGRRVWHERLCEYTVRGLDMAPFEHGLAMLCSLEAMLIELRSNGMPLPDDLLETYRGYCDDFLCEPSPEVVGFVDRPHVRH